jgi:hypothetical protein
MRLLLGLLLGAAACAEPPGAGPPPEPASWRLVEAGRTLVLEREEPELRVRFSRAEAPVGEIVEAEISLPGAGGRRRLEVRPGRPGVRILGPAEFDVEGAGPVRMRFTCETAGPGGIVVLVTELGR